MRLDVAACNGRLGFPCGFLIARGPQGSNLLVSFLCYLNLYQSRQPHSTLVAQSHRSLGEKVVDVLI